MDRTYNIALVVVFILMLALLRHGCQRMTTTQRDLSSDFSSTEIKSLSLGMSLEEVEKIMGRAYEMEVRVGHSHYVATCDNSRNSLVVDLDEDVDMRAIAAKEFGRTDFCCEAMRAEQDEKTITLKYTDHVFFSSSYPALWLHFDSTFSLVEVYAKEYGADETTIYSLHQSGRSIDEKAFERCFGRSEY